MLPHLPFPVDIEPFITECCLQRLIAPFSTSQTDPEWIRSLSGRNLDVPLHLLPAWQPAQTPKTPGLSDTLSLTNSPHPLPRTAETTPELRERTSDSRFFPKSGCREERGSISRRARGCTHPDIISPLPRPDTVPVLLG